MRLPLLSLLALGLGVAACSSTTLYPVGGTVAGLNGSGLVLQDNGGDDLTISSNGAFKFAKPLASGAAYAVTVSQQPTGPAQTCTVSNGTGVASSTTAVQVSCVNNTHSVGGTVAGLVGTGLVLQDNGGDDLKPTGNGAFKFPAGVSSGQAYTVTVKTQPSSPTQVCTVSGGSGTIVDGDVTSVTVNCATSKFTVGGTVTGLAGTGLVLHDTGGDDLPISANGAFSFPTAVASGAAFAVTVKSQPTGPTQVCSVDSGTGTIASGNVTTVAVHCATSSFTVGGSVSGLAGSGLVLQDNLGDNLVVSANGSYTFPTAVQSGAAYSVTVLVQPSSPSQTCVVSNGAGSVVDAAVSTVGVTCTTNQYTVAGTVVGLTGGGLVLQDNGGDDLPVTAAGPFQFHTSVSSGQPFAVTVKTQPTSPSQTCVVSGGAGTVGGGNVGSVTVNCTTNTYAVGGSVSGLAGNDLKLQLGNGAPLAISGNGAFSFPTLLPSGTPYVVTVASQPSSPSQTCSVAQGSGTVTNSDVKSVAVSCVTNTYSVGGTVSGLAGSGLVLRDNGGDDLVVASSGSFKFATKVLSGSAYAVTVKTQPSSPTQTCVVSSGSGAVGAGDVSSVAVSCTTNTYAVSGTLSGLAGTVVLQDNGGDNITLNSNGPFSFPGRVASGGTYAVTVLTQPATPSQTCTVTGGSGPITSADATGVTVTCVTNTFNISGTVSGLAGTGLTLLDNGGDAKTIAGNGSFTFATKVASGSPYAVTVSAQPSSPTQSCTVSGGTGTVGGSDVTTVAVSCATTSFTIGGNVSGLAGTGLTLLDNGGDSKTISGNGTFAFGTPVPSGQAFAVTISAQPTTPWQTCAVSNGSGTVGGSNVSNVGITCASNPYNIKVATSGLAGTVVLQDNGGDNLTVSANTTSTFATKVLSGATYNVTVLTQPSSPAQTCTVSAPTGTVGGADVTVAVSCATNTYSVGGVVSGYTTTGLVLLDNGADQLPVSASGSFTFGSKVASGAGYAVTIKTQPTGLFCSVTSGSGTITNANVTNVSVACQTAPAGCARASDNTVWCVAQTSSTTAAQACGYPSNYAGQYYAITAAGAAALGKTVSGYGDCATNYLNCNTNGSSIQGWNGSTCWTPTMQWGRYEGQTCTGGRPVVRCTNLE